MTEYTTKKIAELLGVSKPTVQKVINDLSIQPERKANNNRCYYNVNDTKKIIKAIRPQYDLSGLIEKPQNFSESETEKPQNFAKNIEKPQNLVQNEAENTAKPQNEELEILKKTVAIIEAQLAEKDKQLAIKDKQIQDLSDRLAEAMQLTKGQQYIAAADKTTELLEADNKRSGDNSAAAAELEKEKEEKSIWKRLFGRKK